MRRLAVLLSAFVLALVAAAPNLLHAKPAFALPPGCEVANDVMDQVYVDWFGTAHGFTYDSYRPGNPSHYVDTALWSWRVSHDPGTGVPHCYRAYYSNIVIEDGSWGNLTLNLHAQICGRPTDYRFFRNTATGPNYEVATQNQWGDVSNLVENVQLPLGGTALLYFADYGIFPIENSCLPQAETTDNSAGSPTWSIPRSNGANTFVSSPPSAWWCTMGTTNIQCYDWI